MPPSVAKVAYVVPVWALMVTVVLSVQVVVHGLVDGRIPLPPEMLVTVPVPAGRSAVVSARNVGVVAEPVAGPENTVLAVWVASVPVKVPVVVTGEPDTVRMLLGSVRPTEVTVPLLLELPPMGPTRTPLG